MSAATERRSLIFALILYGVGILTGVAIMGSISGHQHHAARAAWPTWPSSTPTALVCVQYSRDWYAEYNVLFKGRCPQSFGGAGHYETWWTK